MFVVLIGLIEHESPGFIGHFAQLLIVLVPFGASFEDKEASLIRPSKLHEAGFADVGLQPAALFHIFFVLELAVVELLIQTIQFLALEGPGVHGEEGGAGGFGQFHKIFPAVRIVLRIPKHARDLFAIDVAEEPAHAQAFNEGGHVFFHARQVVWVGNHGNFIIVRLARSSRQWAKPLRASGFELRPGDSFAPRWKLAAQGSKLKRRAFPRSCVKIFRSQKKASRSCSFLKNTWATSPAKFPKNWWRAVSLRPRQCRLSMRRYMPPCSTSSRSKTALTMRSG